MIFHFGDIHNREYREGIDWGFNSKNLPPFFKSVLDKASEIFDVIFYGDLFDKPKHRGAINYLVLEAITYVASKAKTVYILTGNHDTSLYSGNNLDILKGIPNVVIIEGKPQVHSLYDGTKALFCPHIDGISMTQYYEEIKKLGVSEVDLGCGHFFFKENTIMNSPYLDIDSLGIKYKLWMMGHNHKLEQISKCKICTGSLFATSKDQGTYPFSYIVTGKDVTEVAVTPIPRWAFTQFQPIDWNSFKKVPGDYFEKDLKIVTVKCKEEESLVIEKEIRNTFKSNLYEIVWEFEEKKIEISENLKSNDDLIRLFFKSNSFSKDVNELCHKYLGTN